MVSISKQEFSRLDVLLRVQPGRLRVNDACVLIGHSGVRCFVCCVASSRTVRRACFPGAEADPATTIPAEVRTLALSIVRERFCDFARSLAAEKVAQHHGCSVARETLRGWMIGDGLWRDRRHHLAPPHQPSRRRDCLSELVQIDRSEHSWFEDRGAAVHAARFRGRCDEPVDGAAVPHLGSGEAQCVSLTDSLPTDSPAIAED
jgi:hypothetical protein